MAEERVRRWRAVPGRLALGLFLFACMIVVVMGFISHDPVDYRMVGTVGGMTALVGAVVILPAVVIRLRRTPAVAPLPRWRATAFVAVGLAAAAAVCVWRGVVTPWAPLASGTEAACPALDRAGLSQAWPDAPRKRTRDDVDHHDLGVFSYCAWTVDTPADNPAFRLLNSFVWLYDGTRTTTALGWATGEYRDRRDDATTARPLDGVGDEAFATETGDWATVTARRANVLIKVEIYPPTGDSARIAGDLVRKMIAGVHPS